MSELFLRLVNMSISASWIVLAVLLLRLLLRKAPKWITVLLWGIVAVRLICPFTIESVMSLIPSPETISPQVLIEDPEINTGFPVLNNTINPIIQESTVTVTPEKSINALKLSVLMFSNVWLIGLAAMLLYAVISCLRVKRKIGTAVLLRDNIFQSENVVSPFVLGIIRPKIYLPFNLQEKDMSYVIAHEQAHIRRKDHLWKPLGFLLLTLHWFNPLMWLGYVLLCRDIELACDEKVIRELNTEQKADYSQALLTCSVNRRMIAACPLAFGEVGVKNRVKSVLNYKKPAFWIILVAVVVSVVVAVCFLTDPKQEAELGIYSQESGSELNGVSLEIVDADLSAPDPYITVKWKNDTDITLSFGNQFAIYYKQNGSWENCSIEENPIWNLPAYMFAANSEVKHTYKLNGQIMTQPGKYRFEAPFNVDGKNENDYTAWIEFELKEGVAGITVHTFKPVELVYDDGMYSFVQTAEGAPTYMIVNGMQLITKTDGSISEPLGTFEEITLNKENFDSRFKSQNDYSWLANDTLKSLKENNKRIWQLYGDSSSETPRLYILMEQKDGTFFLGCGYYNFKSVTPVNADDSHIRWLYRLEEISESDVGGADAPSNVIVSTVTDRLKVKYPQFFDLSTDGGLTVYIWQMSANNYSCYLTNTFTEVLSDNSFAYDVSASVAEMRAILTTYDIAPEDIVLQPVINPFSSYMYEINDEYRSKVNEIFRSAVPLEDNSQYSPIIDTATFDIDGDGKEEQCTLSGGPTSGLFTFIFSVSENGNLEYFNIFNSPYTELKFEKNSDGIMMLTGKSDEKSCRLEMDINDGNIVISSDGQEIFYWGEQGLNSPYAPKAASALNNAIAKVLKEKYSAESPDGLTHFENYYLLAHETASGTPLNGNSVHIKISNVYLLVYHMKYSVNNGIIEEIEGAFVPTAITFAVDGNGEYTLEEYWTPQNGADYEKDIRSRFPGEAAENALNTENYAEQLIKENRNLAKEYLNSLSD